MVKHWKPAKAPAVTFADAPVAGVDSRRASLIQARRASYVAPPANAPAPTAVPAATTANAVPVPTGPGTITLQLPAKESSKAVEFDKGSRRSVSDYTSLSNKEGWAKWQRQLNGTA